MFVSRSDNPAADWDRHCERQEREAAKYPKCSECGRRIFDDYLYEINGRILCESCAHDEYRKDTSDYMAVLEDYE